MQRGMKIFGVTVVRSEADIIALTLRYHLHLGLDGVFVLDNGSTDGTDRILEQLAQADNRIRWSRYEGEFQQAELTTGLARDAFRAGADWIVPFDADEFWFAPVREFREVLARSKAAALRAQVIHYIQAREQLRRSPEALLTMNRRASWTVGPPDGRALVEAQQIGYVEAMYLPKWISRASANLEIDTGNHSAGNLAGKPETTAELVCLHAPIRSRDTLVQKAAQSLRLEEAGRPAADGWHTHRVRRLLEEDAIDAEWAANSYENDALDVYGTRRPVAFDPTLRDAVAPFLMETSSAFSDEKTSRSQAERAEWQRAAVQNFLTNLNDYALSRTEWAMDLDGQLVRARAAIGDLEARVAERTDWARNLDEELASARTRIAELQAQFLERTAWAQSLEKELAGKSGLIADLERQIAERTDWARVADAETERARAALADLRKEFEERTAWALELKRQLEESRAAVSAF